jgi:hypothetical protein
MPFFLQTRAFQRSKAGQLPLIQENYQLLKTKQAIVIVEGQTKIEGLGWPTRPEASDRTLTLVLR